jgi:processive 1,2-diacylglycerol beta-glucosyltransferase
MADAVRSVYLMASRKVLFLEASGGGGHISITTSIIQALAIQSPEVEVSRVDVIPPLAHKFYQLASRQFVNAFHLVYKATDNHPAEIFTSRLNSIVSRKKLTQAIVGSEPDLIFSDYSLAVGEIPKILEDLGLSIPFIVFVPDPFTVHSIYLSSRANLTMVSTLAAYQTALNKGIPAEKLEITGHPVREEFAKRPEDIRAAKTRLGLDPDAFTILFGGSGHGAEKTLEILMYLGAKPSGKLIRRLIRSANLDYKTYYKLFLKTFERGYGDVPAFQAVCICGDNTELKEDLEMLEFPSSIQPHVYLHADDMASFVHVSDLVVGKAGPNIILETVMANKPFIATYHIKGQEEGNIDFIRTTQLGFVEENPKNTALLIGTILQNKQLLNYTKIGISFAYLAHKDAAKNIASQITRFLG